MKHRSKRTVTITFTDAQIAELCEIIKPNPELHEVVDQAISKTIKTRIYRG
jgi:hypothetical protein